MKLSKMIFTFILLAMMSCKKEKDVTPINSGNDPNFTIVSHNDDGFSDFPKKVEIFDIPIYAVDGVEDLKLLHAANIMAQYLDNDEDGVFIKKWVPELRDLQSEFIHEPWSLTPMEQQLYSFVLGENYPMPIIDFTKASKIARDKIWGHRKHPKVKEEQTRLIQTHTRNTAFDRRNRRN